MPERLPVEFASPWYLVLLTLLPLVYWLARRSLAGLVGRRRIVSMVLRSVVLLLVILALAEFRVLKTNDRLAVIFVLDRSESIPAEQREAAHQYVLEVAKARDRVREDLVGVVVFGKFAGIESMPRKEPLDLESFVTLIEPEATNMAAAIRLAAAAFPEGVGKRIVILSDGNENRGSVLEEVRVARSQGVIVDVVPITYGYESEIYVEKVFVDPNLNVGQSFTVTVVVHSTKETEAILRLFRNEALLNADDPASKLLPGKNVFEFKQQLDLAGKYDFQVRIEPVDPGDDSVLQNNSAGGFTFVEGEPRVLLCTPEPELETALVSALNAEKIAVEVVHPDFLPRAIEEYFQYQAVVFSNVGAHELSEEQMEMFESLVSAVGLGFVMIGGENSFGAGGYQGTPVERLLPVDMEVKQRKVLPNGALAVVVHSCELTNGNYWANRVIQQAIGILSPRDYAGVIYFDNQGQDTWLFPMTLVSQRRMMLSRLQGFNPGDMPSFENITRMTLQGLQGTRASIKHMIILSDGDPSMPTQKTLQAIKNARITISTICYGAHGGIPPGMRQLAQQGGGKFYYLQSPENLPEIFIREATTVQKSLISEEAFVPLLASREGILGSFSPGDFPQLEGFVITSPKALASMLLLHPSGAEDPTEDPVLAAWNYGLGRSIAFTSDAGRRWGKAWAAWGGYQRFWSQCIRWVSRSKNDDRFRVTHTIRDEQGTVLIDAITPDGHFLDGIPFEGQVTGPDFEKQKVSVRQVSSGRYEAKFPANRRGTYAVALSYDADGSPATFVTGLSVPYSPEYARLETDHERLRRLTEASGGKYHDEPETADFFTRDFPLTRNVEDFWRSLLILAVVLFFIDVFIRRVVVDYRKVLLNNLARVTGLVRGKGVAPLPVDARLATLLERKAQRRDSTAAHYQPGENEGATSALTDAGAISEEESQPEKSVVDPGAEKPVNLKQEEADESSYTGRLLAAKRRARMKKEE
jgi:uncharacterized membrane protein